MTDAPPIAAYEPPKIWTWNKESGGRFAAINRPIAGPTHEKELPIGRHPLQLYSLATPNGVKATVMLEELLELGHKGADKAAAELLAVDLDQPGVVFGALVAELEQLLQHRRGLHAIWRRQRIELHGMPADGQFFLMRRPGDG